jgi:gephyrin
MHNYTHSTTSNPATPQSAFRPYHSTMASKATLTVAILIVSTTASKDPSTDSSSALLRSFFANENESNPNSKWAWSKEVETKIVSDDQAAIEAAIVEWADGKKINLIVTTGGTGFSVTDCTPEVS